MIHTFSVYSLKNNSKYVIIEITNISMQGANNTMERIEIKETDWKIYRSRIGKRLYSHLHKEIMI